MKVVENGRFEIPVAVMALQGGVTGSRSRVVAVLHPVAGTLDDDGLGVVEEAVEDGAGDGAVVVEDAGPLLEGLVGGDDQGTTLVTLADDLEEEVGPVLVDGEVATTKGRVSYDDDVAAHRNA